jgi:hypothetical protein
VAGITEDAEVGFELGLGFTADQQVDRVVLLHPMTPVPPPRQVLRREIVGAL